MTRTTPSTTDRHRTTTNRGDLPRPDDTAQRTTAGLFAFVAAPATVAGAMFAPVVTTAALAVGVLLAVAATTVDRTAPRPTGTTDDPDDVPDAGRGVPAD